MVCEGYPGVGGEESLGATPAPVSGEDRSGDITEQHRIASDAQSELN